jgi:hypothetical protein
MSLTREQLLAGFEPVKQGPSVDWVLGKELRLAILSNWYQQLECNLESPEFALLQKSYTKTVKKFFPDHSYEEVDSMRKTYNIEVTEALYDQEARRE